MANDIDTGSISPPQTQAERASDVSRLTESELEAHVNRLLASVGEASGGSAGSVASLVAVWVISQVEEACGMGRLVDPKDLAKDDFATPKALCRVLHRQIRERTAPLIES